MARPESALELRRSAGSRQKNTMPELELGVKPFTDMPANSTACATPGRLQADLGHAPRHRLGALE